MKWYSLIATVIGLAILVVSCTGESPGTPESTEAEKIIAAVRESHGSDMLASARLEFDFRERHYVTERRQGKFRYERIFTDTLDRRVRDVLTNEGFYREVDGARTALTAEDSSAYANSVNSVIYFACLPYSLNEPAVISRYLGKALLEGKTYDKLQITFRQEGGGKDHEDVYVYWIGEEDHQIDYLAYSFHVDGGGARFRKAYNTRTVEGVRILDYINYKPGTSTRDVVTFDSLFAAGGLAEVSRIETERPQVTLLEADR